MKDRNGVDGRGEEDIISALSVASDHVVTVSVAFSHTF